MASVNDIVEKLEEWIRAIEPSATVSVTGKDSIQIRLVSEDRMASVFPVARPVVRTHATPREPERRTTEKLAVRKPSGFNIGLVSTPSGMNSSDLERLRGLVSGKYPFLSVTRLDSKVWDGTCREVVWLASGIFRGGHKWDKTWKSKMSERGGGPDIVNGRFKDTKSVLDAIQRCLDYVETCHSSGGFWWPTKERGKVPRKSLQSFLASTTRSGTEWSPFCEVLWEMEKSESLKSILPDVCVRVGEEAIRSSNYLRGLPRTSLDAYWEGVKKFVDWYRDNKAELVARSQQNRVRLADLGMAIGLVKDWNDDCGGQVLPAKFVYPGSDRWFRFAQWCGSKRGVDIPQYR